MIMIYKFFKNTSQTKLISSLENLWSYGNKTSWAFGLGIGEVNKYVFFLLLLLNQDFSLFL